MTIRFVNEGYAPGSLKVSYASGPWLFMSDGKQYIDTSMAAGTAILGHARQEISQAICEAARWGTVYCKPSYAADYYLELLSKALSNFTHFALCNTGSEAIARLVRIARAYTGKWKIGVFAGGWHGSLDTVLIDEDKDWKVQRRSLGTHPDVFNQVVLLPRDDEAAAFKLIQENAKDLACVLIEPVQGSLPRHDAHSFLYKLRECTTRSGVLLAFDEVLTGGRLRLGGAQEWFRVKPDLATYGKIFGGGLPIGIIAGNEDVMRIVREPQVRGRFENNSVLLGGTFTGNPLTLAAGIAMLKILLRDRDNIYPALDDAGYYLVKAEINRFCLQENIDAQMYGLGSMLRLVLTREPVRCARERDWNEPSAQIQSQFYQHMFNEGVYISGNRLLLFSTEHLSSQLEQVAKTFKSALLNVIGRSHEGAKTKMTTS